MRSFASILVFLLLSLDVAGDAGDLFSTPLRFLGDLLSADATSWLIGVKLNGFEVLVFLAFAFARKSPGRLRPLPIIKVFLQLYIAGFVFTEIVSLAKGVGLVPWKARYLLHVPLFYALFQSAFRNAADFAPIATGVIVAAHIKALLAAWLRLVIAPEIAKQGYATNHGDSPLFAMAIIIVLALAMERGSPRDLRRALLLTPFPIWGMMLNNRRIAWAMLEMALIFIYFLSRRRPWKRSVTLAFLLGAPLIAAYIGIGWNGGGGKFFAPVQKVRSLVDSKDASTYWREVETWNICATLRDHPIIGTGLGGQYTEYMFNDNISDGYKEYREWPHNTVLGLLLYSGMFAFFALWFLYPLTMYLAARSYRFASIPEERAAALMCAGAIVCAGSMAWGDTGLHFTQVKLTLSLALSVAGRLAVSTGAWPTPANTAKVPALESSPPPPIT